jgi:hypothetical protein
MFSVRRPESALEREQRSCSRPRGRDSPDKPSELRSASTPGSQPRDPARSPWADRFPRPSTTTAKHTLHATESSSGCPRCSRTATCRRSQDLWRPERRISAEIAQRSPSPRGDRRSCTSTTACGRVCPGPESRSRNPAVMRSRGSNEGRPDPRDLAGRPAGGDLNRFLLSDALLVTSSRGSPLSAASDLARSRSGTEQAEGTARNARRRGAPGRSRTRRPSSGRRRGPREVRGALPGAPSERLEPALVRRTIRRGAARELAVPRGRHSLFRGDGFFLPASRSSFWSQAVDFHGLNRFVLESLLKRATVSSFSLLRPVLAPEA